MTLSELLAIIFIAYIIYQLFFNNENNNNI